MNNYKWIVTHDLKEVAHFLCELQDKKMSCQGCPVADRCETGLNGWITFLRSEHGGT